MGAIAGRTTARWIVSADIAARNRRPPTGTRTAPTKSGGQREWRRVVDEEVAGEQPVPCARETTAGWPTWRADRRGCSRTRGSPNGHGLRCHAQWFAGSATPSERTPPPAANARSQPTRRRSVTDPRRRPDHRVIPGSSTLPPSRSTADNVPLDIASHKCNAKYCTCAMRRCVDGPGPT